MDADQTTRWGPPEIARVVQRRLSPESGRRSRSSASSREHALGARSRPRGGGARADPDRAVALAIPVAWDPATTSATSSRSARTPPPPLVRPRSAARSVRPRASLAAELRRDAAPAPADRDQPAARIASRRGQGGPRSTPSGAPPRRSGRPPTTTRPRRVRRQLPRSAGPASRRRTLAARAVAREHRGAAAVPSRAARHALTGSAQPRSRPPPPPRAILLARDAPPQRDHRAADFRQRGGAGGSTQLRPRAFGRKDKLGPRARGAAAASRAQTLRSPTPTDTSPASRCPRHSSSRPRRSSLRPPRRTLPPKRAGRARELLSSPRRARGRPSAPQAGGERAHDLLQDGVAARSRIRLFTLLSGRRRSSERTACSWRTPQGHSESIRSRRSGVCGARQRIPAQGSNHLAKAAAAGTLPARIAGTRPPRIRSPSTSSTGLVTGTLGNRCRWRSRGPEYVLPPRSTNLRMAARHALEATFTSALPLRARGCCGHCAGRSRCPGAPLSTSAPRRPPPSSSSSGGKEATDTARLFRGERGCAHLRAILPQDSRFDQDVLDARPETGPPRGGWWGRAGPSCKRWRSPSVTPDPRSPVVERRRAAPLPATRKRAGGRGIPGVGALTGDEGDGNRVTVARIPSRPRVLAWVRGALDIFADGPRLGGAAANVAYQPPSSAPTPPWSPSGTRRARARACAELARCGRGRVADQREPERGDGDRHRHDGPGEPR
jgi:hypothetical protein